MRRPMSALGHMRTYAVQKGMSASGTKRIRASAPHIPLLGVKRTCLIAVVVFAKRYRWTFGKTRAELQELCLSLTGG